VIIANHMSPAYMPAGWTSSILSSAYRRGNHNGASLTRYLTVL